MATTPTQTRRLPSDTPWVDRFSQRATGATSSAIRELLKLTERPEVISFAGGLPAPEVFPTERIAQASAKVLAELGARALQYGTTEGVLPLRELLVRHMGRYGIEVTPANVMITTGSQQALDLVARLLLNRGDSVVMEEPSYLGAIQSFSAAGAHYTTVPIDDEGMRTDLLEEALRTGPRFVYVLPNFQNPAGVTLSRDRRERLVELASRYGVPIVEDDPYGQLRYEGRHIAPLVKIDAEHHGCARGERAFRGGVLYLGTLSKTLAPGFRIGWVVAPAEVIAKLVQLKQSADLHTSTFCQMVAAEAASGGFLDQHVKLIRKVYGERRDAMLAAMEQHFPAQVRWTHPQGGLFLWVTLPEGIDSASLLQEALTENVAFVPGGPFYPRGGGANTCRLNFSFCDPERIAEGIRRLGVVLKRRLN